MRIATASSGKGKRLFRREETIRRIRCLLSFNAHGQSMIETALIMPLMFIMVLNAVNFGYMFYVYLNMAAAPRQGAEYSIQGTHTIQEATPSSSNVKSLVTDSFSGVPGSSNALTRVCSASNGLNNSGTSNQTPACVTYGAGIATFPTDANCPSLSICPDPEAPTFTLNRVDVQYTVTPLLSGGAFNLVMPASMTFHRYIYMRVQ
jgi:Flp pilus assembly protein TadG